MRDLGRDRDLADADLITTLAAALRRWEDTTGRRANMKTLREAVWYFWQNPRMPTPKVRSKYPVDLPWTAAARAAYRDDPRGCRLVIEHSEPMTLLIRRLVDTSPLDLEQARALLASGLDCVVVTPEEDAAIRAAGVGNRMPDGWTPGDDPWVRYRLAGLDVDRFVPLGET